MPRTNGHDKSSVEEKDETLRCRAGKREKKTNLPYRVETMLSEKEQRCDNVSLFH